MVVVEFEEMATTWPRRELANATRSPRSNASVPNQLIDTMASASKGRPDTGRGQQTVEVTLATVRVLPRRRRYARRPSRGRR
jgi:hypothetical protein